MFISTNPQWDQEKMKEYYNIITQHTSYEPIEIELKNSHYEAYNGMNGIMVLQYRKTDSRAPGKRKQIHVSQKITGGVMNYVEHPFGEQATFKEDGSGDIVYIINDREPTPEESLSGEKIGWNLEFLATHYDEDCPFIIKDEKWRKIVESRRARIDENKTPKAHVFDDRYRVRGGLGDKPSNEVVIKTENAAETEELKKLVAAQQKQMADMQKQLAAMSKPSVAKATNLTRRRKKKEDVAPVEEVVVNEEEAVKANFGQ